MSWTHLHNAALPSFATRLVPDFLSGRRSLDDDPASRAVLDNESAQKRASRHPTSQLAGLLSNRSGRVEPGSGQLRQLTSTDSCLLPPSLVAVIV